MSNITLATVYIPRPLILTNICFKMIAIDSLVYTYNSIAKMFAVHIMCKCKY